MCVGGKPYLQHRIATLYMTGDWPEEVDHINGDKADNRWENLRAVDVKTNRQNERRARKSKKSGTLMGAFKYPGMRRWMAAISHNGKAGQHWVV
jgi:hypothetical protein